MASRRPALKKVPLKPPLTIPAEISGLVISVLSILTLLALVSFKQGDRSANWLGLAGYSIAFVLQYLLGLSSYLIVGFGGFVGWRHLVGKRLKFTASHLIYSLLLLFSSCLLLTLLAETSPGFAKLLGGKIYKQATVLPRPVSQIKIRYNLGGVPIYYLFRDLPLINMQHLLSHVGTFLVSFTIMTVACLQLVKEPLMAKINQLIQKYCNKEKSNLQVPAKKNPLPSPLFTLTPSTKRAQEIKSSPLQNLKKKFTAPPQEREISLSKTAPQIADSLDKRQKALQAQSLVNGDMTHYHLPADSLLQDSKITDQSFLKKDLKKQADILEETLLSFGIEAKVGHIQCGPTITSFEVHPAIGVKVQRIKALEDDIALNLKAKSIRIIAPIPGKAAVGVEVPNPAPQEVGFKEMLMTYRQSGRRSQIPILLGKMVNGEDLVSDLAKMPHCIIAGATGSGKSVCINTIVMSIVMNARPDEVKLLMVDPKKVELTGYSSLPHMLAPVITEPHGACAALNWLVKEMERRYEILKEVGVRNIIGFNHRPKPQAMTTEQGLQIPQKMSYIVTIIDELADLMMISSQNIETPIARIAQMARAVGIHLVLATQRPSREVITGLIKANFPTRIAFKVASRVNSQIILDETGAEALLGNGDMLFLPPGTSNLIRAQGAYIRDEEINKVTSFICSQSPPHYLIPSFDTMNYPEAESSQKGGEGLDSLYQNALNLVLDAGAASTTYLQRKLKIGYARAASLMDQLFQNGVISPQDGSKPRKVLIKGKKEGKESALFEEESF